MSKQIALLRAEAHRWGRGLIHQIDDERDQTLCGKSPGGCPGERFLGHEDQITCKLCRRSIASKIRSAEIRQEWETRERQQENERAYARTQWHALYADYLRSETWRSKRAKVMRRANGLCEGCGARNAVQVHHLRYPKYCMPGSDEWIAQEKLFDLRAICIDCHMDVHGVGR